MNVLAIDSTRESLIVLCLFDGGREVYQNRTELAKHNKLLMPAVDSVLRAARLELSDIDCFSAVVGPGSFTGIRVGIATVNGFAYATKKPLISVNEFEIMLENSSAEVALIDALHGNCYAAERTDEGLSTDFWEADKVASCTKCKLYLKPEDEYIDSFEAVLRRKIQREDGYLERLSPLYLRQFFK